MKMSFKVNVLILFVMLVAGTACIGSKEKKQEMKEGILLVTFGSSYPGPKATFANIENEIRKQHPNTDLYWAYTSRIIRKILKKRGEVLLSPEEALNKMKAEGYTQIKLQSLHIIPGTEYNDLKETLNTFLKANPTITAQLGTPLMQSDKDMNSLADCMVTAFNKEKEEGEAVLFMGHGTHHAANERYARFQKILTPKAENFFVGTVEASPTLDDIEAKLKKTGIKTVTLTPLMSVAGDHASNDMAGEEADSWKSVLEARGYTVKIVLKGLGDYNDVVDIWINHLDAIK
ncbi:heme-binding protein [Puteibacter caeruleilacunae]|nr:heme-binding protein [Puteibacter caeruleilacunae]